MSEDVASEPITCEAAGLMRAFILAAGSSRRLQALTQHVPKCLLAVGDYPLLEIHLRNLSQRRISDVWIVVGYLKEVIQRRYGSQFENLKIHYIENVDYDIKGHGYSLYLGKEVFRGDAVMLIHADLYCESPVYDAVLNSAYSNAILIDQIAKDRWGDEFVVLTEEDRVAAITRNAGKSRGGQYIGLARFESEFLADWCHFAESMVHRHDRELNYEIILNNHLQTGKQVLNYIDISGASWINVNYPRDLEIAQSLVSA